MQYPRKLNINSTSVAAYSEMTSHQHYKCLDTHKNDGFTITSHYKAYVNCLMIIFMTLTALGCDVEEDDEGVIHDLSCDCERSDYTSKYVLDSTKRCGRVDYIPYHYSEDEMYEDEIERIMTHNDRVLDCIESSLEQGIAFKAIIAHEGVDSSLSTELIMTDDQVMYKAYSDSNICGGGSDCSDGCGASVNVSVCEAPSLTADRRVICADTRTVATCRPEDRY